VTAQNRDPKTRTYDIYLIDLARSTSLKLTFDPASDISPIWSPDGSLIVWASNRGGAFELYKKPTTGGGRDELLLKSDVDLFSTHWSADGRFILDERDDPKSNLDVRILPLKGDRTSFPAFLQTPFNERRGRLSSDGRWIAYDSDESGQPEVYIQTFPTSGGKSQRRAAACRNAG
jgi:Tol biopolymer transport system component